MGHGDILKWGDRMNWRDMLSHFGIDYCIIKLIEEIIEDECEKYYNDKELDRELSEYYWVRG